MNKKIMRTHIVGFIFTIIVGTLLHFTLEWSSYNKLVGAFSAANESTWEHLKLLAIPMLAFTIVELFIYRGKCRNLFAVRLLSILLGMLTITALFYTYTGIIGNNYMIADISTFIIGVFAAYMYSYTTLKGSALSSAFSKIIGIAGLAALLFLFVYFTFNPPHIPLFLDPVTEMYGINA